MNNYALITGASSGIGHELARLFAADHFNLALVARNEARLILVAEELSSKHNIKVKVVAKDLVAAHAASEIFEALHDLPISILVNNAGFGWQRTFAKGEVGRWLDMMHVNMDALVHLTHLFLPPMLKRRQGRILNVASTAAFQPGPSKAIYFATKAFVYSFSCALAEELSESGVTVTTLCPGITRTRFHERANMQPSLRQRHIMEAKDVAGIAYRGLMTGRSIVIPGTANKVASMVAKLTPIRLLAKKADARDFGLKDDSSAI